MNLFFFNFLQYVIIIYWLSRLTLTSIIDALHLFHKLIDNIRACSHILNCAPTDFEMRNIYTLAEGISI